MMSINQPVRYGTENQGLAYGYWWCKSINRSDMVLKKIEARGVIVI